LSLMRNQCACNQTYHNFVFLIFFFVSMMNVSKFPNSRIDCPKSVFFFPERIARDDSTKSVGEYNK
jgi:hypothetical protein